MIHVFNPRNLAFEAEVVEVFDRDGRRFAKMLVRSFLLEIETNELAEAHLGDMVLFESQASVGKLKPAADQEAK